MDYDRTARRLEPLHEMDVVRIEDPDAWTRKATVLSEVDPRSYTVRTENGQVLRRNRRSLLKSQENIEEHSQDTESGQSASMTPDLQHTVSPTTPFPVLNAPVLRRSYRARKPPDKLIEQG